MKRFLIGLGTITLLGAAALGCSTDDAPVQHPGETKEDRSLFTANCLQFESLEHCPIGAGRLTVVPDASGDRLRVSGLGDAGNDGVATTLPTTIAWETSAMFAGSGTGNRFTLEAISGGSVASRLRVTQSTANDAWSEVNAEFTNMPGGSTYTVSVFDGARRQGSQTGVTSDQTAMLAWAPTQTTPIHPGFPSRITGKPADLVPEGCIWELRFDEAISMTLPNGTILSGDRIEFVEEVDAGGSYTYRTFETMRIMSNVQRFEIWGEEIMTAE